MASNFAREVWRSPSRVSRCSSGVFAPARSAVLPGVPCAGFRLASGSEGPAALLSVELAAVEVLVEVLVEALVEGIAGTWALLLAAQPASQPQARIVTTADARLPIRCIR
jgi:hypothetical protein